MLGIYVFDVSDDVCVQSLWKDKYKTMKKKQMNAKKECK